MFFLKVEKKLKIESVVKIKTGKIRVVQKTIVLITTKPKIANLNVYKFFICFSELSYYYLLFIISIIETIKNIIENISDNLDCS